MKVPQYAPARFNADKFAFDSIGYRNDHTLTRLGLAELLGVSEYIVRTYELRIARPSVDVVFNLCTLMGKNLHDYLLHQV